MTFDEVVRKLAIKVNYYILLNHYKFDKYQELEIKLGKKDNFFQYVVDGYNINELTGYTNHTFGELHKIRNDLIHEIYKIYRDDDIIEKAQDLLKAYQAEEVAIELS